MVELNDKPLKRGIPLLNAYVKLTNAALKSKSAAAGANACAFRGATW